ncbi:Uncharacterised protein [uncultured archaeon]|nr:Uncharacterised protein [uncultured archaeon]
MVKKCFKCGKKLGLLNSIAVGDRLLCSKCGKEEEKKQNKESMKYSMCPFTQVELGQTIGGGGFESGNYTWQHTPCLKEVCAIYDEKNDCCLIRTIAKKLPNGE